MSQFSLNPEMNFAVAARFIAKGNDTPVTGEAYTVRLFDRDIFDNDFIGESGLDSNGYSKISFNHKAFGDLANLESLPDLDFVVYKNGIQFLKVK